LLEELGYLDEKKERTTKRKFMMREVTKIIQKIAGRKKNNSKVLSIVDLTPCPRMKRRWLSYFQRLNYK